MDKGSSVKVKEYDDGQEYLKIKIPVDGVSPRQLRLIAELIEKIEDDEIEKKGFWRDVKKYSSRYLVANLMKMLFQSITILLTLKLGIAWVG